MPYFAKGGYWCSGIAGSGTYHGQILYDENDKPYVSGSLIEGWRESGGARWLAPSTLCANRWPPPRVDSYSIATKTSSTLINIASNLVVASGNGHWAVFSPEGVTDWLGRNFPSSYLGEMGPDGSYCLKVNYHSMGGWVLIVPELIPSDINKLPITNGNMENITNLGNSRLVWTENGIPLSMFMPPYNPIAFPIWYPKMFKIGDEFWQLYSCPKGFFLHPVNSNLGYKIGPAGENYFTPDMLVYLNGHVEIIWASGEGQILSDIRVKSISLNDTRVSLKETEPIIIPPSGESMRVRAFERPMWQAPFYSFHQRYGDTPIKDYLQYGNAITVIGDEADASVRDSELVRLSQHGQPMIVDIGLHEPPKIHDNLTVAWWASGFNIDQLVSNVNRALGYYEKPVIAYLDNDEWPEQNPFSTDRVWPAIQAYRFTGETIGQFGERVSKVVERVNQYNIPMVLTSRFDDFNGSQSVESILECMSAYEAWLALYYFVGHMPFADRRGNGIAKIPQMKEHVISFNYAMIRPNRFDYWTPSGTNTKDILMNKFGQTRMNPVIESHLRKDILRRYL